MTAINIGDISPREQYTATSLQTTFTYNFPIDAEADLEIYQTPKGNVASESADLLTLTTDYTVTGVGVATGGTIVLVTGAATGDILTLQRDKTLARTSVFSLNADIPSEILDEEFNSQLMMIQQVDMKVEKLLLKYQNPAVIDSTEDRDLPVLAASQAWVMNSAGTALEAITIEENGTADLLRADLASETEGSDGSLLVGYYSGDDGSTTVHAKLDSVSSDISVNTADITVNTAGIAANVADIATNAADIASNVVDIAANTSAIANLGSQIRASANVTGATGSINNSSHVTSVTRTATGKYTCVIDNAMSDTNYIVLGGLESTSNYMWRINTITSATQFDFYVTGTAGTPNDPDSFWFAVVGDLA